MGLTDTTYGWDVSNYQADLTQQHFQRAKNEGVEFSIALATDGTGFQNFMFARQLDWGRGVGMLTAAYHYVRDASISQQIANIKRTVPLDCPVIPDSEHGSGGIGVLDNIIAALHGEGYTVPLEYLPRWYWQQIGAPWLGDRGGRRLWASWYPDYVRRTKESGRAMLPDSVWSGYGGNTVAITQFTSSGAAGGYPRSLDLNAFRGTRDELAAVLGGSGTGSGGGGGFEHFEELFMALPDWQQERIFNRLLSMAMGVEGQNYNGDQFEFEQGRINQILTKLDQVVEAIKPLPIEIGPAPEGGTAPTMLVPLNVGVANLYGQTFFGSNYGNGPSILSQLAKATDGTEIDPAQVREAIEGAIAESNAVFLASIEARVLDVVGRDNAEVARGVMTEFRKALQLPASDSGETVDEPVGLLRPEGVTAAQDAETSTTEGETDGPA